jgi:hypothetical protein
LTYNGVTILSIPLYDTGTESEGSSLWGARMGDCDGSDNDDESTGQDPVGSGDDDEDGNTTGSFPDGGSNGDSTGNSTGGNCSAQVSLSFYADSYSNTQNVFELVIYDPTSGTFGDPIWSYGPGNFTNGREYNLEECLDENACYVFSFVGEGSGSNLLRAIYKRHFPPLLGTHPIHFHSCIFAPDTFGDGLVDGKGLNLTYNGVTILSIPLYDTGTEYEGSSVWGILMGDCDDSDTDDESVGQDPVGPGGDDEDGNTTGSFPGGGSNSTGGNCSAQVSLSFYADSYSNSENAFELVIYDPTSGLLVGDPIWSYGPGNFTNGREYNLEECLDENTCYLFLFAGECSVSNLLRVLMKPHTRLTCTHQCIHPYNCVRLLW